MANDRMYKQKFTCLDCKHTFSKMVWESDLEKKLFISCEQSDCKGEAHPVFEEEGEAPMLMTGKMNKQQIKQDRFKRSREHFKREVLPTINPKSMEGKYFNKKYSRK